MKRRPGAADRSGDESGNIEQADAPDQVWREPATRFVLEFMGEVNRLQGTIRGGQFHVGAHRWPLGYTPRIRGRWISSCARGSGYQPPYQPRFAATRTGTGSQPERSLHPISGAAAGVVQRTADGRDAWRRCPQRGDRLYVGLQHARLYNGDERIETRDEELALAQSA